MLLIYALCIICTYLVNIQYISAFLLIKVKFNAERRIMFKHEKQKRKLRGI